MPQHLRPERAVAAHGRRAAVLIVLALSGVAALTLALPGAALAHSHGRRAHHATRLARHHGAQHSNWGHDAPAAAGTVEGEPVGETFKVKSVGPTSQTYTVTATSTTTYFEHGVEKPTIKNVTNEEFVVVFGTVEGTNVTATQVLIFQKPPHFERPIAVGVVTSEPASEAFTIETHRRWGGDSHGARRAKWHGGGFGGGGGGGGSSTPVTVTVHVTPTTTYMERGVEKATLEDVKTGDIVIVFGSETGENSVTATQVAIGPPFVQRMCAAGTVDEEPVGDAFKITTRSSETDTIDVSEKTTYYELGVEKPSLANVKAGGIVGACGTISGTTVTAEKVFIVPPPPPPPVAEGTVLSEQTASSTSFEIENREGTKQTVDVSSATVYTEHGQPATLEDVKKGDRVAVFGTLSGTTVTATEVFIHGGWGGGGDGGGGGYGGGPGWGHHH